ncbi:MAG: NAD(P)/FAD-dependent oxidoreductase [Gemmatimonadaceae bacterium]
MGSAIRTADVVVVGAGVIGASVAYHLAARGCRRVVIVERAERPGSGSTGRATGGFRGQFATAANVALSIIARDALRRFPEELGTDSGYRGCGYLFVATAESQLTALRAAQAVQHAGGLSEAVMLSADDVARLNPAIDTGIGVVGGVYCPTDGFLRPLAMLQGYLDGARRLGATLLTGTTVRALRRAADGGVSVVETDRGAIATGAVVNAAGPWAAGLAALAGGTIPVTPLHRQVACVAGASPLPESMPMTIFVEDGFHLRVRDGRVLLLAPGPTPSPSCVVAEPTAALDRSWLDGVRSRARRRLLPLRTARVDRAACWAGYYEMSPDGHALLGPAPGVPNMILANGSSGHGVMHSPALGRLVAELVLDGAITSMDDRPLRPDRFARAAANTTPDLF